MATANTVARTGRKLRKPTHRFYVEAMPFQVQPFLLAPVLPGETLKNGLIQARVVTDPIKSKLIGWWQEYHFFYVKHRDLAARDLLTEMMLDLDANMSTLFSAADLKTNHPGGTINWADLCRDRVVETWMREEGETPDGYTIDGVPAAQINVESWLQSAALNDKYAIDDPTLVVGTDDTITGSEVSKLMEMWEFQRMHNMTEMTYEDWLATYGIRGARVELHRPELLRSMREWQYPSNTVDPLTGAVTSAVSWGISDRIDKDRFFTEPGFIIGLTITRPKVYLKNLDGNGAGMLNDAMSWLPALMKDDPWTSMKKMAHDKGPLATIVTDTDGYWVDVKDLLLYGDDFVNVARSRTDVNFVSLPNAALTNKYYPTDSDVDGLFVASADTGRQVRQDGVVQLSILGAQVDTTPRSSQGD